MKIMTIINFQLAKNVKGAVKLELKSLVHVSIT